MPVVRTNGGIIDVDPYKIGKNINVSALLETPENFGNTTLAGPVPMSLSLSTKPRAQVGDWFDAKGQIVQYGLSITNRQVFFEVNWDDGTQSSVQLDRSEWSGTPPLFHFHEYIVMSNGKVRLTKNTVLLIKELGLVTEEEANAILGNPNRAKDPEPDAPKNFIEGTKKVVGETVTTIVEAPANVLKGASNFVLVLAAIAAVVLINKKGPW